MTLDLATVDISKCFAPGQAYVALSRVRTLEGLRIVQPFPPQAVRCDKHAKEFMDICIARASQRSRPIVISASQRDDMNALATLARQDRRQPEYRRYEDDLAEFSFYESQMYNNTQSQAASAPMLPLAAGSSNKRRKLSDDDDS